ncbi:MAG: hypothetical protein WCS77_04620 [Elusimicrobiaceae bacterium]
MKAILVADQSVLRRAEIASVFDRYYQLLPATNRNEVMSLLEFFTPDVMIVNSKFAGNATLELVESTLGLLPRLAVVVLCDDDDMDMAYNALQSGACKVLTGRLMPEKILEAVMNKVPPDDARKSDSDFPWVVKESKK